MEHKHQKKIKKKIFNISKHNLEVFEIHINKSLHNFFLRQNA